MRPGGYGAVRGPSGVRRGADELALAAAPSPTGRRCRADRAVEPTADLLPVVHAGVDRSRGAGVAASHRVVVVGAILLINAAGLCVTYGP